MQTKANADPYKRHKTRHPGITYRTRKDGERTYSVYAQGTQHAVQGGEKEALAKQAELRGRQARGERLTSSRRTFGEAAEEWYGSKQRLRRHTRAAYRGSLDRVLLPRFGTRKLASIDADDIARLVRELERTGLSASTVTNHLKPLAGTFKYAVRHNLLAMSPMAVLTADDRPSGPRTREHRVWSPEDIAALLAAADRLGKRKVAKYNYEPLLRTATFTGLRLGEVLGLQWRDVDLDEGLIQVRAQWTRDGERAEPKTLKALRRIPIGDGMVKRLAAHKLQSRYSRDHDFVFAGVGGAPFSHENVRRRGLAPALKAAGLPKPGEPKVTFHDLRHAFASIMIAQGVSPTVLADVMGHAHSGITESIYVHLFNRQRSDEQVRQAMQGAMVP